MSRKSAVHARVRHSAGGRDYGPTGRDVTHVVTVDEHTGPEPKARCGLEPKAGWVLDPIGTSGNCARCFGAQT